MRKLALPERVKTDGGQTRKVGFEIEFAGVDPENSVRILQQLLGGTVKNESAFCKQLQDTEFGTFTVELDAALLTEGKYKDYLATLGIKLDELKDSTTVEEILKDVAATVVPCEIVMPPIPVTETGIINDIVSLLQKEKAKGTGASILYAFGLHINTELASQQPEYILNNIRAFALLYDWICTESQVDFSRRLSPYINPYPDEFLQYIFQPDYCPDIKTLIDDYLDFVPSRNHALDMLPALADIDEQLVMSRAAEPDLIKPRPAFHYRLANCRIDESDWSVGDEWQYWIEIEKLADDKDSLELLCKAWLEKSDRKLPTFKSTWIDTVKSVIE